MNLLAVDTTTENFSVALYNEKDGQHSIIEHCEVAPRRHGDLLLPCMSQLLQQRNLTLADMDALVTSRGPGAFTGVRLGLSAVQGLAYGSGLGIIPVTTLETLAWGVLVRRPAAQWLAVAMDARMNEVYWQVFHRQGGVVEAASEPVVCSPADVQIPAAVGDTTLFVAGTGWSAYTELQRHLPQVVVVEACELPRARWMLELVLETNRQALAADDIEPLYLRDKVAATIRERAQKRQQRE